MSPCAVVPRINVSPILRQRDALKGQTYDGSIHRNASYWIGPESNHIHAELHQIRVSSELKCIAFCPVLYALYRDVYRII